MDTIITVYCIIGFVWAVIVFYAIYSVIEFFPEKLIYALWEGIFWPYSIYQTFSK